MRVLLIEDDSATAQSIELMLKSESFNVYTTDLGEEGVDLGKLYDYDIILLDLNLPDMSGFEVLRSLRVSKVKTPILILSGLAGIEDKVKGLGFGADDYMTKPFHKDELIARIHAIVRRSKGHAQSVINTGDLTVNLDQKTVEVGGARVHLTGKEYQMLELLSLRKGTTLTKEMFLNHLYGGMDEPELKIIDVFICKLRKKLANASNGKNYIETVWGRGYVLREPTEEEAQNSGVSRSGRDANENPAARRGFCLWRNIAAIVIAGLRTAPQDGCRLQPHPEEHWRSGASRRWQHDLLRVVKDDAQRVAPAVADAADAVAHVDAIDAARALHRPVMHRKDHRFALAAAARPRRATACADAARSARTRRRKNPRPAATAAPWPAAETHARRKGPGAGNCSRPGRIAAAAASAAAGRPRGSASGRPRALPESERRCPSPRSSDWRSRRAADRARCATPGSRSGSG